MKTIAVCCLVALFLTTTLQAQKLPVTIKLSNIKDPKGIIYIGLYTSQNDFPSFGKQAFACKAIPNGKDTLTVIMPNIPTGEYAIAVYQDLNQNGKLDNNLFGIPKEPYAFSRNVHPKLSKPGFEDCKVTIAPAHQPISIQLIN